MAFLKTLTNPPAVIITTAYHQYSVEGFNLNVTDYLLKPFEFERFLIAVNKVKSGSVFAESSSDETLASAKTPVDKDYLFLNVQKKESENFILRHFYIESQREYVKIVRTKKEYLSKISTHEIEGLLPANISNAFIGLSLFSSTKSNRIPQKNWR